MDGKIPRSNHNLPHSLEPTTRERVNEICRILDHINGKLTANRELQYNLFQKEKHYHAQIERLTQELKLLGYGQQCFNFSEDTNDTRTNGDRTSPNKKTPL